MKNDLENVKADLLDLKLGNQSSLFSNVFDYFEKSTLIKIDEGFGIKVPADGFAHYVNSAEDDKLKFALYEAKDEYRILISISDLRSALNYILESSFKGFSLEEIVNSGAVIPVYKIVAAK